MSATLKLSTGISSANNLTTSYLSECADLSAGHLRCVFPSVGPSATATSGLLADILPTSMCSMTGTAVRLSTGRIMPQVFISYSHSDRDRAEALANSLSAKGFDVWWDTALLAGENFRDSILANLTSAEAVIVLWSPDSIRSRFVIDEADVAAAMAKLISVTIDDLPASSIPLGFRSFQCIKFTDHAGIDRGLQRLGIGLGGHEEYSVLALTEKERVNQAWQFVKDSDDPQLVRLFQQAYPNSPYKSNLRWMKLRGVLLTALGFAIIGGAVWLLTTAALHIFGSTFGGFDYLIPVIVSVAVVLAFIAIGIAVERRNDKVRKDFTERFRSE